MKKIILAVILLAAAGGITYYLLQKKKQSTIATIDKEIVLGRWKIDSLVAQKDSTKDDLILLLFALDSNVKKQEFKFFNNGQMISSEPGSSERDTSFFIWGKGEQLIWKEKKTGLFTDTTTIIKLDKKDFVLQSSDSTLFYLKRIE